MKVIVPIKNIEYVDPYCHAGADEFYGSCIIDGWETVFGTNAEYNRRGNFGNKANSPDEESFLGLVSYVASKNKHFHLALNALALSDNQIDFLVPFFRRFQQAGGYAIIVTDLSLFTAVKDCGLKVVVSSCAEVTNFSTAEYYKNLGVERIILPRDLTIDEIISIRKKVSDIEYEVFFLNSGCRFSDGNCLGHHGGSKGELCRYCDENVFDYYPINMSSISYQAITENGKDYSHLLKKACSFCSLYELIGKADSLKIVGRAAKESKILKQLELAKQNIEIAYQCSSEEEYLMRMYYPEKAEQRCLSLMNCYYRSDMIKHLEESKSRIYEKYEEHKGALNVPFSSEYIDYIGLNTSSIVDTEFKFKAYYSPLSSVDLTHDLIENLRSKSMIRLQTCIRDSLNPDDLRFDLGLKNRTNDNVLELLSILNDRADYFENSRYLIEKLAAMKITDDEKYALASLYFVGIIENNKKITALKFHFLNRFCEDTNRIGRNFRYDDDYYIDYLRQCNIAGFCKVIDFITYMIDKNERHLWMTGIDIDNIGNVKFKQYFKCKDAEVFTDLLKWCLEHREWNGQVDQIRAIKRWYDLQNELELDGIAVCNDDKKGYTLNLYFKISVM